MSYDSLLIHTVTIQNPVSPAGSSDRYGNEVFSTTSVSEKARVQQVAAVETQPDRDTRVTRYHIFLRAGSAITSQSTILWDSKTFDVDGRPNAVDGMTGSHHVEADLVLREG